MYKLQFQKYKITQCRYFLNKRFHFKKDIHEKLEGNEDDSMIIQLEKIQLFVKSSLNMKEDQLIVPNMKTLLQNFHGNFYKLVLF